MFGGQNVAACSQVEFSDPSIIYFAQRFATCEDSGASIAGPGAERDHVSGIRIALSNGRPELASLVSVLTRSAPCSGGCGWRGSGFVDGTFIASPRAALAHVNGICLALSSGRPELASLVPIRAGCIKGGGGHGFGPGGILDTVDEVVDNVVLH